LQADGLPVPPSTRSVNTTFKVSVVLGKAATSTFCRLGFSIALTVASSGFGY
jgi:hypothetical protein